MDCLPTRRHIVSTTARPVEISIFPYGSKASDFNPQWADAQKVWQLQICHDAVPSFTIRIVEAFSRYLADMRRADPDFPSSLMELKQQRAGSWLRAQASPRSFDYGAAGFGQQGLDSFGWSARGTRSASS